jgi:uncharacterized protein YbbC (DUF1343 family)
MDKIGNVNRHSRIHPSEEGITQCTMSASNALTGLDVLLGQPGKLRGRKIGLIANPTGVTADLRATADALASLRGVTLRALFAPEHGVRGEAQDGIGIAPSVDEVTGLPVHSLYGANKRPSAQTLGDIDLLIYDIQDVGCRYYTYPYTLSHVMEAAAECGIEVMVLDRPNPINGVTLEGPILDPAFASFVGRYPIPVRHGLTVGEFARFINAEFSTGSAFSIGCRLSVAPMQGWRREVWFDETGLPWVSPSPNIPTLEAATVYPGTCLFEGTNMSEGRGTTHPFEFIGASWVDGAHALAADLNALKLPGARFRPIHFEPTFSKHAGKACHGVQVHVTNRDRFRPFETGLHMLSAFLNRYPRDFAFLPTTWEGALPHFDLLAGSAHVREALMAGTPIDEITRAWQPALRAFRRKARPYLLYPHA